MPVRLIQPRSFKSARHNSLTDALADVPYPGARALTDHFFAAAEGAGLRLTDIPLTGANGTLITGREGEALSTQVVTLGDPDARHTIWITTGLHGCEGPAGSLLAVWMLEHRREIEALLGRPRDGHGAANRVRIVLAHTLNPWGASWFTRFTQGGVDPNRNFRRDFPQGMHTAAPTATLPRDYRLLDRNLNPRELSLAGELWHLGMVWLKSKLAGTHRVMRMIATGQQVDRNRLLFVGWRPTQTNLITRSIIREHASSMPGTDLHLDIHTALGRRLTRSRQPLALTIYPVESPEHRAIVSLFGGDAEVASTKDGKWSGSDIGTIEQAFFEELPAARRYLGACVELGTVSIASAIAAVWRQQAILRSPDRYSAWYAERARRLMYNVFFPKDRRWRAEAVPSLWRLVYRGITALQDQPAPDGRDGPPKG